MATLSPTESIGSYGSFSSKQRSNTKAAALANLAAKRKQRNAARFKNRSRVHPEQQQQPSHETNKIDDTRQEDPVDTRQEDPVDVVDASTATSPGSTSRINNMQRNYELEQQRIKTEKEIAGVGNEALILVYGYNPNLYEDVFDLPPNASFQDIKQSYEEQRDQLEFSMATVFTSDVPDDEINGALNESQKQAAILCGMTSAHMEQMHPRNFLEVKMDALKRAFDILGDEQSRIEYDAVLMEFQESARGELQEEVVDEEEVYAYNVARDIDYGVNGDYSYDYNETDDDDDGSGDEKEVDEEEVDDDSWNQSRTSFDSHTEATDEPYHQPYEETQSPPQDQEAFQSPSQAYVKHPWKQQQQQQHSPRDPFEFEQQQFHQPPAMPQTDNYSVANYSVASSRSTRSIHVELFDPFDLQGADQINYEHLPMVEEDNTHAHESVVEEKEEDTSDETVTVFLCPLPEGDNEDDDEITVGEVIKARERGEDIDVSSLAASQPEYPNMVDFVPKKEKGIKKLRSVYQSMKRSVGGGSSKGSKLTSASDSNTFRSRGVSVMSFSSKEKAQDYDQAKKRASVLSLDYSEDDDDVNDDEEVLGEQIYQTDDEDDDDSEVIADDLISDLTQGTPWNFQQQQQQLEVAKNNEDLEIESFLNMANNFRAMDKASHKSSDTKLSADEFRTLTTNEKEDYLGRFQGGKPYRMESLVSMSNETHEEDEGFLDDLVGVIDEIEGIFDESLENMSRYLSCE